MGTASQERTATPGEVAEMGRLLREAMDAGAIGISTSYVDVDDEMRPVPSQWSDHAERLALAQAMAASGRGVMQTVPRFFSPADQLAQIDELATISRDAGVMCTLAPIVYSPVGSLWSDSLRRLDEVNATGARVYGQSMTRPFDINMRLSEHSFLLLAMPSWRDLLRSPLAERERRVSDPEHREVLVREMDTLSGGMLEAMWIGEVVAPENAAFSGQRIPDVAAALGVSPGRALVEVATADGLRTEFQLRGAIHGNPDRVAEILDHPNCLVGASDAGAHVSQFCGAGDTTYLLGHHVRERGDFTLERAVHRITGELAAAWGIADRGVLRPGTFADLVLLDPDRVDRGPEEFVQDVPGAANRYIRRAAGIDLVAVNGEVVVDGGAYTAARPGRIV